MSGRKKTVQIYVNPKSDATRELTKFIGKHLDEINKRVMVKIIKVNSRNLREVQRRGISKTPTLVYGGKKYEGTRKIITILRPPSAYRDGFGGVTSAEEMVHRFMVRNIYDGQGEEEEDDEDDPRNRGETLRKRMATFQKRRPAMEGMDGGPPISGGRKVTANRRGRGKKSFSNDEDFMREAGAYNETPTERYMTEEDGDLILENERNRLADLFGRKVGRRISSRR